MSNEPNTIYESQQADSALHPRPLTSLHLFQRLPLCLPDEEPHEDYQRVVEDAKHEERSPAEIGNCVRCDLGEDEIEQPLRRCANCNSRLTDPGWEYLAHIQLMPRLARPSRDMEVAYPWYRTPRDVVAHRFKVNHGE